MKYLEVGKGRLLCVYCTVDCKQINPFAEVIPIEKHIEDLQSKFRVKQYHQEQNIKSLEIIQDQSNLLL